MDIQGKMRVSQKFKEKIMNNIFSLTLAFVVIFAGCAEKESDPVIVSPTVEESPHSVIIKSSVKPATTREAKTEEVTGQINEYHEPDVIFVPTPQDIVEKMLELAQVKKDDLLYDLGCGDGRIVVTAAKKYGCRAVGYDIDPERVNESLENVKKNNAENLVKIEQRDIFTLDLSEANVITLYLLPSLNVKLFPQLEKLKSGSRIVSHDFRMRGVKPDKVITLNSNYDHQEHKIYLWTTPLTITLKNIPDSIEG